ncbi:DnaJ-like subfamily C member 16 [Holothuria leucospilota]|uniref:DnaJ-like subfamily C member 16 n=1 Tax=Holothuria leucospilota TaxID=206669 RepID=A0A9Q1BB41_HOLLE|nr:DnaJ-like subfamily C member 16 [Holothuria leucospilota]
MAMANWRTVLFSFIFLALLCDVAYVHGTSDPYEVLGVSRSASQQQIKKSYKKLAREWHPDKNNDPGAGDRFIEIQQAYEILSDDDKRSQYDRYGHVDENGGHHHRGNDNMFHGFHFPGGGQFSFKFSSHSGGRSQQNRVSLRRLQAEIFPESYSKPYLLLVTGDWCFSCMRVESLWDQIRGDLELAGIGTGKVNADYDYNVLSHLGVYRKPSVVAIVQEIAYRYDGSELSKEHLKQFVSQLIPSDLVKRVNDESRQTFLSQFQASNKPSVLLFTRRSTPSALYSLLAFKYHSNMNFGFVQTTDAESKNTVSDFDVRWNQREMLIFKEMLESPAEEMEISNIKTEELSQFLSENKYLYVPRLTSQSMYEELCPESPFSHSRRYCIILCMKDNEVMNQNHESFIHVATRTDDFPVKVQFAYITEEKQSEFLNKLGQPKLSFGILQVAVLWRVDGRRAHWQWLPEGWHRDEPDADRESLVNFLTSIKWTKAKELPELKDEFAPNILTRSLYWISGKVRDGYRSVRDLFTHGSLNEVSMIVTVGFIYLLCLLLVFLGLLSPKQNEGGHSERRDEDLREGDRQYQTIAITLLCKATYDNLLRDSQKSQIVLVLLITDETKSQLFRLFKREVYQHAIRCSVFTFSYMYVDLNLDWCNELLGEDQSPEEFLGHILAIRPAKKYLNIFTPRFKVERDYSSFFDTSLEDQLEKSLDGLNMWLDRVLDGGLDKVTIETWPEMKE